MFYHNDRALKFKYFFSIFLVIFCYTAVAEKSPPQDISLKRNRLVSDLFLNYNPSSKPGDKDERVDVSIYIELQHFDFRETDGAFHFIGFLNAQWFDKKLIWNPVEYDNLTQISVSQKLIWVPDFEVYNNAPDKFMRMHRNGLVVLSHSGLVNWSDAIEMTIFCSTNMHNWPHDSHVCHLALGSWTHHGYDLDIVNDANASLSFDDASIKNLQYRIKTYKAEHVSTTYAGYEEPYITMKYYIEFERRSSYGTIFNIPIFTVIIFTLLSLIIEPHRGEKILLNGINIIVIVFQLLHFAGSVGKFARHTPYIVLFYSYSLVIATASHLICVFALWTSRSSSCLRQKVPACLSNFINGPIAGYILNPRRFGIKYETAAAPNVRSNDDCSSLIPGGSDDNEWLKVAVFVERVAVFIFSSVFLLLTGICIV